jgi:hypothetical protein
MECVGLPLQRTGHHCEQELRLLGQVRSIASYSFPLPTRRLRGGRSSVPIPITTTLHSLQLVLPLPPLPQGRASSI